MVDRTKKGNVRGVFTGNAPRQAALKAGNRATLTSSYGSGCRWISPKAHRLGCLTRSGSPWSRRWARRSWKSFEALLVIAMQDSTVAVLDEMDHEFIRMLRFAGAPRCIADVISYLKT